jgi:hypothetical protein
MSAGSSRRSPSSEQSGIRYTSSAGNRQVNARSIVARLEEVGGTETRFTDELPALPIPGHGERYEDCGDEIPRFCAHCGHTTDVGRTCYRSGCPRCWKGWDRKRAATICAKLEALRAYKEAAREGWDGWKFHHLAISPPEGFALDSKEPLQRTFDLLKEVLAELGAETGYLFYHPFRGEDGDDRGFWKELLPDGDEQDMADIRGDLSHEPHFHAVVLSKHVSGGFATKVVERKTGWVVERITKGEDSTVSIYDRYDLARVVTYCLSHTGIGEDRAAYRAYGEVANFTADPKFERGMDAAVRSVVPNTLGLRFDSLMCQDERMSPIGDPDEKVVPNGHGDGAASPPEVAVDVELEEVGCAGRILDITKEPLFIEHTDWMADAPHADQLRRAWEEWRYRVDGDPAD